MTTSLNMPEQGQLVQVRSRQWIVNEVKPGTLPLPALNPTSNGSQNLLTLSSVEDDGLANRGGRGFSFCTRSLVPQISKKIARFPLS